MRLYILLLIFGIVNLQTFSQNKQRDKAKLVVGIVVDQMRNDYIERFWNHYSEDGFKRLTRQGFRFKDNHFTYIPTKTAPGHASIYTGTTPKNHGIIANAWFDKKSSKMVYCAGDSTKKSIGTIDKTGEMSPHRLLTTTITDENRLATQMRGKTIGIALKDRGAILPAGHTANAAYWFQGKDEGRWISSSYYMEELPQWVTKFNNSGVVNKYMKTWETLYSISTYKESGSDLNKFERGFKGKETATFPYDIEKLRKDNNNFDLLRSIAYGNDFTTDFAITAIKEENLGQDEYTDFLTISFSSTDYIGHNFGVNSKEVQDTYIRLDKNIAELLRFLDQNVGEDNYILFLTSDHGGINVPAYLASLNIPAGYFNRKDLQENIQKFVEKEFAERLLIKNVSNDQVFFNHKLIQKLDIDVGELQCRVAEYLTNYKNIHRVYTRNQIITGTPDTGVDKLVKNGFNPKRSGDIVYLMEPSVVSYPRTGSTHGSGYSYDTHVPLFFYGKDIQNGATSQRSEIVDIAPTIATMLGISYPNTTTGKPLNWLMNNENKTTKSLDKN